MEPFDIRGFIEVASTQLLFVVGIVTGLVAAAGQFKLSGVAQKWFAVGVGVFLGAFYFLASWGWPGADIAMWFAFLITTAIVALVPIGAYELVFKPVKDATK